MVHYETVKEYLVECALSDLAILSKAIHSTSIIFSVQFVLLNQALHGFAFQVIMYKSFWEIHFLVFC